MKHQTYAEIRDGLSDPDDSLFGGSLAYLTIDTTLSLLLKLLKIRAHGDPDRASTFQKLDLLIDSVRSDAYEYIEKDGEVFAFTFENRKKDIDDFLVIEARKVAAMIENLTTVSTYVAFLTTEIKGSIKNDFIMIRENLNTSKENLKGIFKYEVSKIKDEETRHSLESLLLGL